MLKVILVLSIIMVGSEKLAPIVDSEYGRNSSAEKRRARLVFPTDVSPNNISLRDLSWSKSVSEFLLAAGESNNEDALDSMVFYFCVHVAENVVLVGDELTELTFPEWCRASRSLIIGKLAAVF